MTREEAGLGNEYFIVDEDDGIHIKKGNFGWWGENIYRTVIDYSVTSCILRSEDGGTGVLQQPKRRC